MSIVKEQEVKNTIKVKGILRDISPDGLTIEDEKSGELEYLTYEDFTIFIDKVLSLSVSESFKSAIQEQENNA